MKKIIAIVAGDPDSINSEIIAKTWKNKKLFKNLNIFVIGNFELIKKQLQVLKRGNLELPLDGAPDVLRAIYSKMENNSG